MADRKTLTQVVFFAFFEIDDVLANFIVVMVANEKSKDDIIAELNDSKSRQCLLFDKVRSVVTQVIPRSNVFVCFCYFFRGCLVLPGQG